MPAINFFEVLRFLKAGYTVRDVAWKQQVSTQAIYQALRRNGYNNDGTPK